MCSRTFRRRFVLSIAMVAALVRTASTSAAVDFEKEIKPIIESACLHCHNETKAEGDLRLDSLAFATADAASGPSIVAGDPEQSSFYTRTVLPDGDEQIMPPEGARLDTSQTELLKKWIEEGAKWPNDSKLEIRPRIDFAKHVQPILEMNCVSCHSAEKREGDFDLSTRKEAFASGSDPPAIKPFDPAASQLYLLTILAKDDSALMPPTDQGGPLTKESIDVLRLWIAQGAIWPKGLVLRTRAKKFVGPPNPDDLALVQRIHDLIVERAKAEKGEFANYSAKVPQTSAPYDMVAIKGGEFLMGSPTEEQGRADNEGPQAQRSSRPILARQIRSHVGRVRTVHDHAGRSLQERRSQGLRSGNSYARRRGQRTHDAVCGYEVWHGEARISGHLHDAARGQQVLPMAQRPDRPFLSPSDRSRVGIRLPGRNNHRLLVRRRSERPTQSTPGITTTATRSTKRSGRRSRTLGGSTTCMVM